MAAVWSTAAVTVACGPMPEPFAAGVRTAPTSAAPCSRSPPTHIPPHPKPASPGAKRTKIRTFSGPAIVFTAAWSRFFRRRPLEHLLNGATTLAKSLR